MAKQRVWDREEIRQRLPGRGPTKIKAEMERLMAPNQPAVGVVAGASAGPANNAGGDKHDPRRHNPPHASAGPPGQREARRDSLASTTARHCRPQGHVERAL